MSSREPNNRPHRSVFRRLVRIFVKIFLTVVIILVIVIVLIQTPYVQNIVRGKAEKYLSRKLKTRVNIGNLYIKFPESVVIRNIFIADRKQDTLVSAGLVDVDIHMWGLLHNDLHISSVRLEDFTAKIKRELPDTAFNFQFIVDAFAGKAEKPDTAKSSTPMKMYLGQLTLDRVRFVYQDVVTGNDVAVYIGHNETELNEFNPGLSRYVISKFSLDGLRASIRQDRPLIALKGGPGSGTPVDTAAGSPLQIGLGNLALSDDVLDYNSSVSKMALHLQLGQLAARVKSVDLSKNSYGLQSLSLDSTSFTYDDNQQPRLKAGMDYNHLAISNLALEGRDLNYSNDSISGEVTKGRLNEISGFRLTQLQTHFLYTDREALLTGLILRTPGTLLQKSIRLRYPSVAGMMKDPAHTIVDLDMPGSRIQIKDLLLFAPSLAAQPALHPGDIAQVSARVTGNLDALEVKNFQFSGIQGLKLDLSGRILHPLDAKHISADMALRDITGTRKGLVALLPKGSLPDNIVLPDRFTLKGKIQGGMTDITTDADLLTSSGAIRVKGYIRQFRDPKNSLYDLSVQTHALDLGYILKDSAQWGLVTADFTAKGRGFDPKVANARLHGEIQSAVIKKYNYQNFLFDGSIANQQVQLQSSVADDAVRFNVNASADLSRKYPSVRMDAQIDTLDMLALHFTKDTLQFSGHIFMDVPVSDPDSLIGEVKVSRIRLQESAQHLSTDSILLRADRKDEIQDIQLHAEMADLDWKGQYKLTQVARAIQHTLNHYYRINGYADSAFTPEDWTLQLHAKASPLVLAYMPSLKGTDTLAAVMVFNSDRNDLRLSARDPFLQLGDQAFRQVDVEAATGTDRLNYRLGMKEGNGGGLVLHQTSLYGYLANSQLFTSLLLKDSKGKDRFQLAGQLDKLKDGLKFMFNPDSLRLNYDQWAVSRDNYIQYDSAGLLVHHLEISSHDQSLTVNSTGQSPESPIDVQFSHFKLATLSSMADQDSLQLDGLLDGKAELKNVLTTPTFTADLAIKNLSYDKDSVGDLAVKIDNEKANAFAADIALTGHQNDVQVKGDYYTGEGRMDMKLDLRQLNLASMKPFAGDQVQDMRGFLKGGLAITGTMDKPGVKGNLHFDSTLIVPEISGEPLKLSRDNIEFDEDGFNFSEFALQDSAGNKATVDGNVYTTDYRNFRFDISVNAGNFRAVNAPQASNRMFYGKMNLDLAANLTGSSDEPKVDGDLRINKRTNFVFVMPENDPEVVSREGVVRFIDSAHATDTLADRLAELAEATRQAAVKGLDLSMNIQTDSSAIFTMVIDERNGDALTVQGRSNLVFGMDRSGRMELTGGYEVESGSYNLSLNVLKRKFDIQKGSTITWTGSPTDANIDLTANYTANTPSIDLIENEIAGRSQDEINKFKQKLPFLVTLKMEGELLKPKITFDISLPTDVLTLWPDVDQKLQQIRTDQSELDKQVFALLLLNRFVGEDPLQSAAGGGTNVGSLAFQSASQILTNQLDQLASSLIKGVDIHFDLNNQQDFSTGTEQDYTELNVSVSKRLFSDRVQVSVGSNFDVQGTTNPNQNTSNIAGDVAVDYRLTKDGRYMLRAYRKNQYEAVIEGQVVETGLSFILTFDYNKFVEIFKKTREDSLEQRKTQKPVGTGSTKTNQ